MELELEWRHREERIKKFSEGGLSAYFVFIEFMVLGIRLLKTFVNTHFLNFINIFKMVKIYKKKLNLGFLKVKEK